MATWDRSDGNFVTFLPKNMKPSTLQREVNRAYAKFYSPKQILRRFLKGDFWAGLRRIVYAFRAWETRRETSKWAKYLETVEGRYYDENEHLIEERLGEGIHPAKYLGSSKSAGLERATIGMRQRLTAFVQNDQ